MTASTIFAVDGTVGIDFSATSATNDYGDGYTVLTNQGPMAWVLAGADIDEGELVKLTSATTGTGKLTATLLDTTISASLATKCGIVHKNIANTEYGWVFLGPFSAVQVLTTTGVVVGTILTTHTTAGTVSTGGDTIAGLAPCTTTTAGLSYCYAVQSIGTNL